MSKAALLIFAILITLLHLVNTQTDAQQSYTVQEGDNLFRIGMRFNMTVDVIAEANGIQNPDQLQAGAQLQIPEPLCPVEEPTPTPLPDANLCFTEWECSSPCEWKVGWCVGNLGLSAAECQARFCSAPAPAPKPKANPIPRPTPTPIPPCAIKYIYDEQGRDITSTVAIFCSKLCLRGGPLPPTCSQHLLSTR